MSTNSTKSRGHQPSRQPTHVVKMLRVEGPDRSTFERIGVGWQREDGSIYVRLAGTQIVSDGFTIYTLDDGEGA